jgi:glycine cleavage system H protein
MPSPSDRRYTESHEWFKLDGDIVTVGITQFAADELTDITYVEMQGPGTEVGGNDSLGEVESVKTTSEVYTAVPGEIVEANEAVVENPGLVNSDPFGEGWLVRIRATDTSGLEGLMDHAAYDEKHAVG